MLRHHLTGDGQAESEATVFAGDGGFTLLEGVENSIERAGFDTDAVVSDVDSQPVIVCRCVNRNRTAGGGKFDGV